MMFGHPERQALERRIRGLMQDASIVETHERFEELTRLEQNEGASRFLAHTSSLNHLRRAWGDPGLAWLPARVRRALSGRKQLTTCTFSESGRRDSNPRPSPWQGEGFCLRGPLQSPDVRLRPPGFQYVHPIRPCSRALYYRPEAPREVSFNQQPPTDSVYLGSSIGNRVLRSSSPLLLSACASPSSPCVSAVRVSASEIEGGEIQNSWAP